MNWKKTPRFDKYDGELILKCPNCRFDYTHQVQTDVYERQEDEVDILGHVKVDGKEVDADKNMAGNPSSRRHGVVVSFTCEGCEDTFGLSIYQHKGQTMLGCVPSLRKEKDDGRHFD